jgi:hypothetical protein
MKRHLVTLFSAAVLTALSASAYAGPAVEELPIPGLPSQGSKLHKDDSALLPLLPDANEVTEPKSAGVAPQAVFRSGCIFRPFQTITYTLTARNIVLYRVVPNRWFDVTMRVNYVNLRSFFVDRFFRGGAESIRIQGPARPTTVRVTIGGFRNATGCFAFSATP